MKMKQEIKRYARKVKGKLTTVFAPEHLEAIRKPSSAVVPISSSILAVMKGRTTAWSKPVKHTMNIAHLYQYPRRLRETAGGLNGMHAA